MNNNLDRLAIYPGSFDPFTFGHLDIVERALSQFERVEIMVAVNTEKEGLLPMDLRCDLIRDCVGHLKGASVVAHKGLVVERAREVNAVALIRGLRQVADFDYEFRLAFANRRLFPELETVFLMTSQEHAFVSASIVRDIHKWGGDLSSFVPEPVIRALRTLRSARP
jgi:pantetheine-phosphate adenylyltransferase